MAANPTEPQLALGLRERKKLQTRQRISDLATRMFLDQGFDAVRVADIAERVGVSEKTIFNYFPSKESLVFDRFDAQLADTLRAVTQRPSGLPSTRAFIEELMRQMTDMVEGDFAAAQNVIPRFGELLSSAPTLRAAWVDHRDRMVSAVAEVLADELGVDALDPEPRTAARALISLTDLSYDSMLRNVSVARSGPELMALMRADLERGARLLDTGLWSLSLMIGGRRSAEQVRAAANLAEQARGQVISALREARRAWAVAAHAQARHEHAHGRGRRLRGNGRV